MEKQEKAMKTILGVLMNDDIEVNLTDVYLSVGKGSVKAGVAGSEELRNAFQEAFGDKFEKVMNEYLNKVYQCTLDYTDAINEMIFKGATEFCNIDLGTVEVNNFDINGNKKSMEVRNARVQ